MLRQITRKEVAQFAFALGSGFGDPVPPEAAGRFEKFLELDRTFCCFDGDELVGTSANFSFDMTIPGNIAACAGVTMITVRPTHRRRGLLNRMMRALIDDARGRGEPLGALWASEESIYQRYGFGLASNQGHIDVERARAQFLAGAAPVGRVRLVPREEAIDELPPIYEQLRPQVPGMLSRTRGWWGEHRLADTPYHRAGGSTLFCGIWEGDEGPDGYVLYRMQRK